MQVTSSTFSGYTNAPFRNLINGVLISWDKQTASGINYFTIGTSTIGGNDILKSTGGGTIAMANQYKYTKIPASGIVGWSTSMSLDQYPYGIVQRQADIVLPNTSTAYLAASGTSLGPYIDSGRPVIIQAGFGNETIPLFTGYSDSPVNDINARTTSLHCYDAIDYLNSYTSQATAPIINQRADQVIATLLAEAGFSSNQYILERSLNSIIAYLDPFGLMIGDIIRSLCEAEAGIFFADESGIMHFWNRQHFSNNTAPVATLSYSNVETLQQQNSPIINYVEASSNPLSLVSGVQNVYSLNQPYYLQANGGNALNGITNPSFEVSTSGWSGNITRTTGDFYVGSASASGTSMVYDLSSTALTSADAIGYNASAQFYLKTLIGRTVLATLSGSPVGGSSLTGIYTKSISGTNQWQNFSLQGSHFAIGDTGGISSFINSTAWRSSANVAVTSSGYLYVFPQGSAYYSKLDPAVAGLSVTTAPPGSPDAPSVVSFSGRVYSLGGYSTASNNETNACYVASPQTNGSITSWTTLSSLSYAVQEAAATIYGSYIYVLDGYASGSCRSAVQYALINNDGTIGSWSAGTSLPVALRLGAAAAYNGYLYFTGGIDSSAAVSNTVYYTSINANGSLNSWSSTTLPVSLCGHGCVIRNGYIYIVGGNNGTSPCSTVYYAKLNSNGSIGSWSTTSSLPATNSSFGYGISGNYLYVIGGESSATQYAPFNTSGISLTISGSAAFLLDAVSTDVSDPYFDGDSSNSSLYTYTWNGTRGLSSSSRTAVPRFLTVQAALSSETYSIVAPVASGLNNPSIGSEQSFYSFSSTSGIGGIFGTDPTSSMSLVNYSVSGTTAFLTFQNNSTNQAFLTNLQLYGTVASPPSIGISQYYSDQNSINKYRLNPANNGQKLRIANDYIPKASDALGLCEYLVNGYSVPYLRHTLTNFSKPQLQFGDCVNLYNRDTGETRTGFIFGIKNSMDNQGNFSQSLIVQERDLANYFTIGTSNIGGVSQIAP